MAKGQWGARLRILRGDRTQAQMAEAYRVSSNYWWKLEHGVKRPGCTLTELICLREGVSEAWLLTGEGPGPEARERTPAGGPAALIPPTVPQPPLRTIVRETHRLLGSDEGRDLVKRGAELLGVPEVDAVASLVETAIRNGCRGEATPVPAAV